MQDMERSNYYIELQMYCRGHYMTIASFDRSSCEKIIHELFDELRGDRQASDLRLLRINLLLNDNENSKTQLRSIHCTLDELAENTKIIIKKTFRSVNFD
ncbi:hypothetical protein D3C87_689680 [compost metagenome]|jgi:hypothetical protein